MKSGFSTYECPKCKYTVEKEAGKRVGCPTCNVLLAEVVPGITKKAPEAPKPGEFGSAEPKAPKNDAKQPETGQIEAKPDQKAPDSKKPGKAPKKAKKVKKG